MGKRFVAMMAEEVTKEQRDAITAFVKAKGFGFWHWVGNAWLLSTDAKEWTAEKLRDELRTLASGPLLLVLEVKGGTWSAFGTKGRFDWLHKNWKDE